MNILILMIPISLALTATFLISFIMTVHSGQMDDLNTPALRILDDERENTNDNTK
ncbi:MAG: cbb3-type cytochrome oxidase assembly protein CcoS [Bdellovibrionota bacterium]